MVAGARRELHGYADFSSAALLLQVQEMAINFDFPQMARLTTLRALD